MRNSIFLAIILLIVILCSIAIQPVFAGSTDLPDSTYKQSSYSLKSQYEDIIKNIKSTLILSKDPLSGLEFDNSEAKEKIDTALKIRQTALSSYNKATMKIKQSETYWDNKRYQDSYKKFLSIDTDIYPAKDKLYSTIKEIKQARDLEKQYQENNILCFLVWCTEIKNTYGVLDSKIQKMEDNLITLEHKITNLEKKKDATAKSIHKSEIQQKNKEIQKIEQKREQQKLKTDRERKQLQGQIIQKQLEKERQERELQEQIRQNQIEADRQERLREQEKQDLISQQEIEIEKQQAIRLAQNSPLIHGLVYGKLKFYVNDLPSYSDSTVKSKVEYLADWMDGKTFNSVKLERVYNYAYADLTINWVKDYQEEAIGRQIGDHLIVGLGATGCDGDWKPFDDNTVYKIMWHEIGHAMGYAHSKDSTNVMYEHGTGNDFSIDYDKTINLKDGWYQTIRFCDGSGQYFYMLEGDNKFTGFTVYAVPPTTSVDDLLDGTGKIYTDCGGKGHTKFSSNCTVSNGAYLFIHNPLDTVITSMNIHVKIYDLTDESPKNMQWDKSAQYYSSEYLNYIWRLFH